MAPLENYFLARALGVALLVGLLPLACQGPEEFFRTDGDLSGLGGSPPGTGGDGTGGEVATGGVTGTGGIIATGGVTGTGGIAHTGGVTGTGGVTHTGGVTGTGGVTHTGGVTGAGGVTHTGGVTGTGGLTGTGGVTHTGGAGGVAHTGGVTGTGGRATGGVTGTGGRATGGVTGGGGKATGGGGAAGAVGTGPCAGLCTDPTEVTTKTFSSGNVGTGAVCFESKVAIQGGNCSNVTAPRTFSINGKVEACGQNWPSVPAMLNGGYCYQFTAGQPDYSAFTTF